MKSEISPKVLLGLSAAVVIVVVGLLVYFFRASDPASRAPIPYQKFDYGAHMQQMQQSNRQPTPATGQPQPGRPASP